MENATKALLMAAGVLIGIVILSLGVYLYGTIGNYVQMSQEEMNNQALIKFNTQFYNYTAIENQKYTFQDIITIANNSFNAKYLSDITFSSNDFALNALLSLLPKKINAHLITKKDEFIDTLCLIFEEKVYMCTDCNICRTYKIINSAK